jgi:hypothetical protein
MCSVQTYNNRDRKIGKLQMIIPEGEFVMVYQDLDAFVENFEYLFVKCSVRDIFPEPQLEIRYHFSCF